MINIEYSNKKIRVESKKVSPLFELPLKLSIRSHVNKKELWSTQLNDNWWAEYPDNEMNDVVVTDNNGDVIIISVPPLTEERRRDLVKQAKHESEEAKIGVRNHRKDANTDIKKLEKDGTSEDICKTAEDEVQNLTNAFIKKIDEILVHKEAEIMKV
jgi:hypothetical protein